MTTTAEALLNGISPERISRAIHAGQCQDQAAKSSLKLLAEAKLKSVEMEKAHSEEQVKLLEAQLATARKELSRLKVTECGLRQILRPEDFDDDIPY